MSRRGRKRQLDVESRYWQLVLSGMGAVEACRAVGITRKTGYRWRAENGGVPPARLNEEQRSNRYLSLLERQRIATLRGHGLGVREIARRIGRSASTVSRELRRNVRPHDNHRYDADLAHARARDRGRRPRRGRLVLDEQLRQVVQDKLELEWSPEQIAQHLRDAFPDRVDWHVCHETIYQAIYNGGKGGLSRTLTRRLRTGRPLRKRRRRAAVDVDLGSGIGDGTPQPDRAVVPRWRLLCPPRQPVDAAHQREHQRPLAPVLRQGHRPQHPQPRQARRSRASPQPPSTKDPRLGHASRNLQPGQATMIPPVLRRPLESARGR